MPSARWPPRAWLWPATAPTPSAPAKPADSSPTAEAAADAAPAPKAERSEPPRTEPATPGPVSYEDVKRGIIKLTTERGRQLATQVLAEFGVAHGKDLRADQYPAVLAAIAAHLARVPA